MSDLVMKAGQDGVFAFGPVYRGGDPAQPIDLSIAGTKLWFTVKQHAADTDAAAKVQRTYLASGGGAGITVAGTGDKNTGTIIVPRADVVALALTETVVWSWDLLVEEPGAQQRDEIDSGAFKIRIGISRPA